MTRLREIVRGTREYCARLEHLASPPHRLYCEGDLSLLDEPSAVAVVGTRRPSAYGLSVARQLGRYLAEQNIVVISGLARGIDKAAHLGCLEIATGKPLAVVGCGLDQCYPPEHTWLQNKVAKRGLLLSEYPRGSPPVGFHFPQRNRIVAALCHLLVVVEAPARSGALISVEQALEMGREVLVVPGPMHSASSLGNLRLLKDGAAPLVEFSDVLEVLEGRQVWRQPAEEQAPPLRDRRGGPDWRRLLNRAGSTLEELCYGLDKPPDEMLAELTRAELEGTVVKLGQRYYNSLQSHQPMPAITGLSRN